jgi:hypothetical protein
MNANAQPNIEALLREEFQRLDAEELDYVGLVDAAIAALQELKVPGDVILQRLREAEEPQPGIPEAEQAPEWQLLLSGGSLARASCVCKAKAACYPTMNGNGA